MTNHNLNLPGPETDDEAGAPTRRTVDRSRPAPLVSVAGAALVGVQGQPVQVEVHVSPGIPGFDLVGQSASTCRAARDRVRAALLTSGMRWPTERITVNLAPPGVRKPGASLDLAIAVGLLTASGQLPPDAIAGRAFLAELGLDGTLRPITGTVPLAEAVDAPEIVVAQASVAEARLVGRHQVRAAGTLAELAAALRSEAAWPPLAPTSDVRRPESPNPERSAIRFALEVAAAGWHHTLFVAPPGMDTLSAAHQLVGLLPDLDQQQAMEVTRIYSAAGHPLPPDCLVTRPPLRAPKHSTSVLSLVGGGTAAIQPGEASLAHRGVLFLDELGEFAPLALDHLRQPLTEGVMQVSRGGATVVLPAAFLLLAAMPPCPCRAEGSWACRCSDHARLRYARRVPGPLFDRLDIRIDLHTDPPSSVLDRPSNSAPARVHQARERSTSRGVTANSVLPAEQLDVVAPLTSAAQTVLEDALRAGQLTGRGVDAVRRLALTIADLAGDDPPLGTDHAEAALALRGTPTILSSH